MGPSNRKSTDEWLRPPAGGDQRRRIVEALPGFLFFAFFYFYLWLYVDLRLIAHVAGLITNFPAFFTDWTFFHDFLAQLPAALILPYVVRTRKALDLRGFQNSPDLRARFGSFNRIIQSHGEPLARLLRHPTPPGHLPIPITGATPKAPGSSPSPSDYPMNQH